MMQQWIRWLRHERHLKEHSLRQARIIMKNFFKFVVDHTSSGGVSSWSPPTIPVVRIADADPDILSVEEQLRIIDEMPERYQGQYYAMCLTIRPGEVRTLEIAEVTSGVCWKQRGDATSRESNKTRRTFRPREETSPWQREY